MMKRSEAFRVLTFSIIGVGNFVIDSAILLFCLAMGAGPLTGRLISFSVAITCSWYLNRVFTYKNFDSKWLRQWVRFVLVNSVGGAINLLTYTLLVYFFDTVESNPIIGVAAGSVAGLGWNYIVSKIFVFKTSL